MLKKLILINLLILAVVMISKAATPSFIDYNYSGYLDTVNLSIKGAASPTRTYTKKFPLLTAENCNLVVSAKDTSNKASSLASDSTAFAYGYQIGCFVLNINNVFDTAWQKCVVIDTLSNVSATSKYYVNATDLITDATTNQATEVYGLIDTVAGVSIRQVHSFVPNAMPVIRFWVQPVAGCKRASFVKVRLTFTRRSMIQTHTK